MLLRMHDACSNNGKASNASEEDSERPTKKQTKEKPQNQKKQRKGLGANPGHKESQISQIAFDHCELKLLTGPFRE